MNIQFMLQLVNNLHLFSQIKIECIAFMLEKRVDKIDFKLGLEYIASKWEIEPAIC